MQNKIIDYYNKAFLKGAGNSNTFWTTGMKTSKRVFKSGKIRGFLKKMAVKMTGGLMWPNMFPTSLDPITGNLLYNLVRLTRPKTIVEIGTFKGYSAICLAQGLEDNKHGLLYTIDPVEQQIVHQAIKKSNLGQRVSYIIGSSFEIIPYLNLRQIDLVFIDGNHGYVNCREDFDLVKDLIPQNGLIVFHDTIALEGPRRVIKEIQEEKKFEIITLPTITGVLENDRNQVVLISQGFDGFIPLGLSICRKL